MLIYFYLIFFFSDAFSNGYGNTIEWKANPSLQLGGDVLTQKDIAQLNLKYSCNAPPPPPPVTTKKPITTQPPTQPPTQPLTQPPTPTTGNHHHTCLKAKLKL